MTPTFDNVFLREIKKELKTNAGIILTQDVDSGIKPALVVAVGPDCKQTQVGDTAYVNWKDGAMAVTVDNQMGVLINEKAIMGVSR